MRGISEKNRKWEGNPKRGQKIQKWDDQKKKVKKKHTASQNLVLPTLNHHYPSTTL